jgi:uncharacterized protein
MKFTREDAEGRYTIHAYQEGEVTLNALSGDEGRDEDGRLALQHSFIVTPSRLIREWPATELEGFNAAALLPLQELRPELLLLGTGRMLRFPEAEQLAALIGLGLGYEVMDSAAACRTYNILAGEGRQVAAAIILDTE